MFMEDIPAKVSINEAIELAKKYDDDKSYAFVNGILNAVAKSWNGRSPATVFGLLKVSCRRFWNNNANVSIAKRWTIFTRRSDTAVFCFPA